MFPKRMMLCLEEEDHFHRCKSTVADLARRFGCEIVIFHARPRPDDSAATGDAAGRPVAPMKELSRVDPEIADITVMERVVETDAAVADAILGMAERMEVDLLVLATHGRSGIERLLHGSITESVMRTLRHPVLALDLDNDPEGVGFDRIVAPTDFSLESRATLELAVEWATELGVGMTVLHAVTPPASWAVGSPVPLAPAAGVHDPRDAVAADMERLAADLRRDELDLATHVDVGGVTDVVRRYAAKFRHPLTIVSTAGRDGIADHLLGTHAERTVRSGGSPVLVLPEKLVMEGSPMARS